MSQGADQLDPIRNVFNDLLNCQSYRTVLSGVHHHHHHVGLLCNDKPQCSTNIIPVTNNINVQIRQKMSIGLLKQHMSGYGAALH